jgi:phage-related protein
LCEFKKKPHRLMAFRIGDRYILTHGFKKKDDDTPPEEINRALALRAEYLGTACE